MPIAQSSHLQSYDYDLENQTLKVQFTNGAVYQYTGVPAAEFNNLVQAGGGGTYFWANIRDRYPATKMVESITEGKRR